jgi:hypothetical protein
MVYCMGRVPGCVMEGVAQASQGGDRLVSGNTDRREGESHAG